MPVEITRPAGGSIERERVSELTERQQRLFMERAPGSREHFERARR